MKLIIEARLEGDGIEATDISIPLAVIERHDDVLEGFCRNKGFPCIWCVESRFRSYDIDFTDYFTTYFPTYFPSNRDPTNSLYSMM